MPAPWLVVVVVAVLSLCVGRGSAKEYSVGDSGGWNTGVDYATWASQYTFKTGDSLKFSYAQGVHTVQQVSADDYKACSSSNAITSGTSGNTVVKLAKAQTYYFICGVPGHCQGGMQLSVEVTDNASAAPKSAPSPTPTSLPTNHKTPSATTTPTTPTIASPTTPSTPTTPSSPSKSSPLLHPYFASVLLCLLLPMHAFIINLHV